jgi:hypothetical protein
MFSGVLIFSQENENSGLDVLLRDSNFFARHYYQNESGVSVEYKDVLSMVSKIPENNLLLKQEKTWRIVNYSLIGVFLLSFAGHTVYSIGGFEYADTIMQTCLITGMFSFLGTIVAGDAAQIKLQRSVDNYNLYIMGIRIGN